jgi:hypothetical protein
VPGVGRLQLVGELDARGSRCRPNAAARTAAVSVCSEGHTGLAFVIPRLLRCVNSGPNPQDPKVSTANPKVGSATKGRHDPTCSTNLKSVKVIHALVLESAARRARHLMAVNVQGGVGRPQAGPHGPLGELHHPSGGGGRVFELASYPERCPTAIALAASIRRTPTPGCGNAPSAGVLFRTRHTGSRFLSHTSVPKAACLSCRGQRFRWCLR